ncbi:hypothetical protein AJ80_05869 [Polytolypa hystricis UAMH7299]|uniref:RNB domain-containing protein n=1 Tax=Polytolypa hystricis (strain UAMH7299) TaxID=1447883 RepID=A0A2B7Y052_POLH7|nr:hypothetical protein AJ80_05869 [Polytolypa hystricis UAMH7299]
MLSPSPWLRGSRLAGCRGSTSQAYVCARCTVRRLYSAPSTSSLSSLQSRSYHGTITGPRKSATPRRFHNEKNNLFRQQEQTQLADTQEDLVTFERHEPVRDYLRKWQENAPVSTIDPIIMPGSLGAMPGIKPLSGNMLSDELVQIRRLVDITEADNYQQSGEESDGAQFLRPGDLVLLKSDGGTSDGQLAVYVRSIETQLQFYTSRGKWRVANLRDLDLVASRLADIENIKPLLPYFPETRVVKGPLPQLAMEGGVPRPLGAALVELMNKFEVEAQAIYRKNLYALDNIYNLLADEKEFLVMTLEEIATEVLGLHGPSLTDPERLAIHNSIQRQSFYVTPNQNGPLVESYTIRPRWQAEVVDTVIDWARDMQEHQQNLSVGRSTGKLDQNPITSFITKTSRIVYRSRQSRSPTMVFALGPTATKLPASAGKTALTYEKAEVESFSETDMIIIDYLRMWTQPPLVMKPGMLRAAASMILRSTGLYDQLPLIPATGYLFLQELGVFSPWENLYLASEQLLLPKPEATDKTQELETERLVDSMKHLRKDWGDLPVFCVDDVHTTEIDDGFSLERVPGSDDTFWIHIHVANPSAFISSDHDVAKRADEFVRSMYAPEQKYRMLPASHGEARFSLAPGRPALTFSAKVNSEGAILDSSITNSYINNVVQFPPGKLRKLFGIDYESLPKATLTVGGTVPDNSGAELGKDVPSEHHESLHLMRKLLAARFEKRIKQGALDIRRAPEASTPVVLGIGYPTSSLSQRSSEGHHYTGDPVIQLSGQHRDLFEPVDATKDDMVSHTMQLAGEVAARWCKDRGIPLIYSGTMYHPEHPKVTNENVSSYKGLSLQLGLPRSFVSAKPAAHVALGMEQYTKCTSPLRRFSDILAHWQIEAALRHEAETGKNFAAAENSDILPFSETAIDQIISRSSWRNSLKDRAESRSRDFWACQLFFRAFYFGEAELPATFKCVIVERAEERGSPLIQDGQDQYLGSIIPFGLRCMVAVDQKLAPVERGDVVEIELSFVDMYHLTVIARMLRLEKRPDEGELGGYIL